MDSKIGFEMNLIVVEAIRGRCASFNGFGDIWWTDNPIYFSSIDYNFPKFICFFLARVHISVQPSKFFIGKKHPKTSAKIEC